jgi:DNA-binding transcriptional MerR regulator
MMTETEAFELTKKSHYKFSEVLEMFTLKPYILRFWESEFEQISPLTSDTGQKVYTPKDLFYIKKIKGHILDEKLPIQKVKILVDKLTEISPKNFSPEDQSESIDNSESKKPVSVEVRRFTKSIYSKSQAQTEMNRIKETLLKAKEKIDCIKKENNWTIH